MNTYQLQCVIDCDANMKRKIIGVYAADEIPKENHTLPYGFIVNTDPINLPGRHWIACFITDKNILETFDSYGNSPDMLSPFIKRYMKTFKQTHINTKKLQSSETTVCGQYCLFYLICRCRGYTMQEIINNFNNNYHTNDQFVYNFIDDRFDCCMHTFSGSPQICKCVNKM